MFVSWSTIRVHAESVFDVWYACPRCEYAAWARARGAAEGADTGLYGTASRRAATRNAEAIAHHDAQRRVLGSPCPRCGEHHPEIVALARAWKKKAALRRALRVAVTAGAALVAAVVVPFMAWGALQADAKLESVLGGLVAVVGFAALPVLMWRELAPLPFSWTVFARTPGRGTSRRART